MSSPEPRPRDRRWRKYFRRCRITLLLVVLALVGALIWLNLFGLPDFLRHPLVAKLRERGLDLQFSTLRLHFYRGIVAEQVQAERLGDEAGPRFAAKEADLNLSWSALLQLRLAVSAVVLRDGQLTFPISDTNAPDRALAVEKIRVHLRFLEDDSWSLDDFQAAFAGADFLLSGVITNASALRDLRFSRGTGTAPRPPPGGMVQQRLRRFADTLEQIRFTSRPEMRAVLSGDARQWESFTLRLTVNAPDADTPWGRFTDGRLTAKLLPAAPLEQRHAEIELDAASAHTPWADGSQLHLNARIHSSDADTNLLHANVTLDAAHILTRWAYVTNAHFTAQWQHALTNAIPLTGQGALQADDVISHWGSARSLQLAATLGTPTNPPAADASWAWWKKLQPYALAWTAHAARLDTEKLGADDFAFAGDWSAPLLRITNLHAAFPEGEVTAHAQLDVPRREASFDLKSTFDGHRVAPLLTEKSRKWLGKYTWATPPHITGSGAVTLPAWTNRQPDWRNEVAPTLRLAAFLTATNCAYLGAPADWVRTHISYTNLVWRLPDLVAGRPEGKLELSHVANDRTHEYWFGLHSTISPDALRPVLGTNAQRGLNLFRFTTPPDITGEVWGRWRENDSIGFRGRVNLTNVTFREQSMGRVEAALQYTNRVLEFLDPRLERGTQTVTAAALTADFNEQRIYFTNVHSTAEPLVIARCIGPKTARLLEPYRFLLPPSVAVNGHCSLSTNHDADLRFDLDGGPFEWWQFKIPHIAGRVHWLGDSLTLTNIGFEAYDGAAAGYARFDFRPGADPGSDFRFAVAMTNADLRLLIPDMVGHTNHLEGRVSGDLVVTNASTDDKFTWNGYGQVRLRDGLIWAIPVFGALSKPLDVLMPGLGNARITEGAGHFIITNGVIFSDALEMRAPAARLECIGTVDFDARLNARVSAMPLRNPITILTAPIFWPLSKIFEYQITGTLSEPKLEPVHLPNLLLHPLRTFEGILTGETGKTNAAPVFKKEP